MFQSPEMYGLFQATEMMKPVVVGVAEDDNDTLAGVLLGVTIREMTGLMGYFSSRGIRFQIGSDSVSRRQVWQAISATYTLSAVMYSRNQVIAL